MKTYLFYPSNDVQDSCYKGGAVVYHQIGVFEQPVGQNDFYMLINGETVIKNGYSLYPTECIVTEEFNSEFSCTIKHPIDPFGAWKRLKCYNILRVPYPVRGSKDQSQLFIILSRDVSKNEHGEITITCTAYHIWYYLNFLIGNVEWNEEESAKNAAQIMAATMTAAYTKNLRDYGFEDAGKILYSFSQHTDDTDTFPIEAVNFKDRLGNATVCDVVINGLIPVAGHELYRDNFYFSLEKRRESAAGSMEKPAFRIAYSENIKSISVSENYEESKEKMCFSIGENEEQNSNVLSIKDSFSPFALPYVGVYSTSSLENAIAEFKNINHPIVSYQIDFLDLKSSVFFKDAVIGNSFDVGDIGTVYDTTIGISTTQMITRREYDVIRGEITNITLGNVSESVYGMRTPSYATGGSTISKQVTEEYDLFLRINVSGMTRIYFALSNVSGSFQLSWWDGVSTPFDANNGRFSVRKYIPIGTDEIWIGIKLLNGNIDKPYSQILGFRSSDGNVPNIVTTFYAVSMSKKVFDLEGLFSDAASSEPRRDIVQTVSFTNAVKSIKSETFAWQRRLSTIYFNGTLSEFNVLSHPGQGENDFYSWFTGTHNGEVAVPYGTIAIICNDGEIKMNKKKPEEG